MKITRNKKAAKYMAFYKKHFGFFAPYNVLIDGTFCYSALENKVQISDQLPKYLGCEVKIVTTACCIVEVEALSKINTAMIGAWQILKKYPTQRCGHKGKPVASSACIKSMLDKDNPNRYFIATVDSELRTYIRNNWRGVPILFLSRSAPTLEKPPKQTKDNIEENGQKLLTCDDVDKLTAMKVALGLEKNKKDKIRKRLTGAERKRRQKRKLMEAEERKKEKDRQLSKIQLQKEQEEKKLQSKIKKKQTFDMDINTHISSVLGIK